MAFEHDGGKRSLAAARRHRGHQIWQSVVVVAAIAVAALVSADPYPPYWSNGSGAAIHFAPVGWPAENAWVAYTRDGGAIIDARVSDPSNGGTSPQNYVNVSSGCTDLTAPSIYYAYDSGVLFFRWRVQQAANTYATGPSAGSYGSANPWNSALWTVLIDTNGDGYRDFAVQLDGSNGSPAAPIDRLVGVYSTTLHQTVDYLGDPSVHLLAHNPTAFIDQATSRILSFQNALTPTPVWPNGSSETMWDYGTTRATLVNTGCGEYFIDYQIPLGMLNASGVGGPTIQPTTPVALFFATANSLSNPLQKDAVVSGDFIADPSRPIPYGDVITPVGGAVPQPIVRSVTATDCGPVQLGADVTDTLTNTLTTTVSTVEFHAYHDANGNGAADDAGSAWTAVASGSTTNSPVGHWTAAWNSATAPKGQYLIGVKATDAQGHVTYSYLSQAEVDAQVGATPPNYANPDPAPGVVTTTVVNGCGADPAALSIAASASEVSAGDPVTFTVTVTNPLGSALTVSSVTDLLPPGFVYQSTGAGTLGAPSTSPAGNPTGPVTLNWTFSPAATVPASSTRTLIFTATATTAPGVYGTSAGATTGVGALTSNQVSVSVGAPRLTLQVGADRTQAAPGDTVVYTLAYANDSPVSTTNTVLEDTLPTGLDFVSATGGGTYDGGTRKITWSLGGLAAASGGGSVTLTATFSNPYPDAAAIPLVNGATLASDQTAPLSASASTWVSAPRPSFRLQVDGGLAQVAAGGQVTLVLTYANVGVSTGTGVQIALPVPAGFSVVNTGGGTYTAGTVTWTLGTVAAGAGGNVQVVLQAGNPYTGTNPSVHTGTLTSNETSPVTDSYTLAVTITGNVCSTYYFRETTTNVGAGADGGVRRITNTTAPLVADTGHGLTVNVPTGSVFVEAVRFYQDPVSLAETTLNGNIQTSIYIDRQNGPGITIRGTVYDYDPAGGTRTSLGTVDSVFNGSLKGLFQFDVAASGTLGAGHRLLWLFEVKSNVSNQSATLLFEYGGTVANSVSGTTPATFANSSGAFCTSPPAAPTLDTQVAPLTVGPGGSLAYTIPFGNAGQATMTGSALAHELPAGVTYQSATLNGAAVSPSAVNGQQYTFAVRSSDTATAGQVTGGQSGTLVVLATVSQPFTGSGSTLTATSTLTSAQTAALSDTASTSLLRPDVTIAKSADRSVVDPGATVTYTLTAMNGGHGNATAVTVTDVLPAAAYYEYVANSATLNGSTVSPDPVSGGTLTVNVGALASGATATMTFQMRVTPTGAPAGLTTRSNTAAVTDAQTTGTRTSNGVDVTVRTTPVLSLAAATQPASGPLAAGEAIVYALTAANVGSGTATDVVVASTLPASTVWQAGSIQVDGATQTDVADGDLAYVDLASGQVRFALGSLAGGVSRTLRFTVKVAAALPNGQTPIANDSTMIAGNAPGRQAATSLNAQASPTLTLSKSAPTVVAFPVTALAAPAAATTSVAVKSAAGLGVGQILVINGTVATVVGVSGSQLTLDTAVSGAIDDPVLPTFEFLLTYANSGTATATGVTLSDTLAAGLAFVSGSNGASHGAGVVDWSLGAVAPGTSGVLRLRVRPTAAGTYANTASITATQAGPVPSNTTSTAVGSLLLDKSTTTPSGSSSGGVTSVTYVVRAVNQHPTDTAADVSIADALPAGFAFASTTSVVGATPSVTPAAGDTRPTWSGFSIPGGAEVVITFTATVSNAAAGTHQNEVTATSSNTKVMAFDALATTGEDVTFGGPLGTTATLAATASIVGGSAVTITVADVDLNTDPGVAQTITVTVVNQRTGETETVTLTETGHSTGVFTATLATAVGAAAGSNHDGSLNVVGGDTLRTTHTDGFDATGGSTTLTADTSVQWSNAAPTLTVPGAQTIDEDAGLQTLTVSDIGSGSATETQTLVVTAVSSDPTLIPHPTVSYTSPNATATLTYAPVADQFGTATITVTVNDGAAENATTTKTIAVTVRPVNDPPSLDALAPLTMTAGTIMTVSMSGIGFGPANEAQTLTVTAASADLAKLAHPGVTYTSPAASGSLVLTAAPAVRGPVTVTVTVDDGGATNSTVSRDFVVTIVGHPVNTPPTLTVPGAQTIDEDAGTQTLTVTGIGSGSATETQTLVVTAVSSDPTLIPHPAVGYTSPGADATLTYAPVADQFGSATITVTVNDGGAENATATRTIAVTVLPVNDPPTLDAIGNRTVALDQGTVAVPLSGISFGPANEAQALTVVAVSAETSVVGPPQVTYTSPQAIGSLALPLVAAGTATLTVTVDDGGGIDATVTRTFTVTVTAAGNTPPTITPIPDQRVRMNTPPAVSYFTIGDAETPADQLTVTVSSSPSGPVALDELVLQGEGADRELRVLPAPGRCGHVTVTVEVSDGELSASTSFTITVFEPRSYYFAEGATGPFFDSEIVVVNPNPMAADATLVVVTDGSTPLTTGYRLPPVSRTVIAMGDLPGLSAAAFAARLESTDDLPLVVERTMRWDGEESGGHAETAIDQPQRSWYFAEGNEGLFSTFLLLANFEPTPATATVRFMTDAGTSVVRSVEVPGLARLTMAAASYPELAGHAFGMAVEATGPIVAERSMYFHNRRGFDGGHVAAGQPLGTTWLMPEGSTWMIAETFLLLANPGTDDATVTLTFRTESQEVIVRQHRVPAGTRTTVNVGEQDARLADAHFWIEARSDRPIVLERSMYWTRGIQNWRDGHAGFGSRLAAPRWALANGWNGGPEKRSSFLLFANPSATDAVVRLTFGVEDGRVVSRELTLPAGARLTYWVNGYVPDLAETRYWTLVESTNAVPIVVEHSQYWNPGGLYWSAGTTLTATMLP